MEKSTVLLGVRKKKPFKQRKKSFYKVLDYLKSDTYMFVPLLSYPSSGFPKSRNDIHKFGGQGVVSKESAKENNGLLEKVGNYLSSDYYMYAPLVVSHETDTRKSLSQEPVRSHVRSRFAVSTSKLVVKNHLSTDPLQDVVSHDGKFKTPPPLQVISGGIPSMRRTVLL